MKKITSYITVNNRKHIYSLEKVSKDRMFVVCKDANIAQEFLAEDVANLLVDLPNLIGAEKEHNKRQSEVVRFRISPSDKLKIEKKAISEGYDTVSDYMRHLALNGI